MTLRSLSVDTAVRRAHWYALGLSKEDMAKPKIAVINSSSELAVCFAHLDGVAKVVKEAILVAGGYQASGMIDGNHVDIEDLWSGTVGANFGKPLKYPIDAMTEQAIRGPGVCAGMATANTMHCVVEALGMCVAGSAPVRAN